MVLLPLFVAHTEKQKRHLYRHHHVSVIFKKSNLYVKNQPHNTGISTILWQVKTMGQIVSADNFFVQKRRR